MVLDPLGGVHSLLKHRRVVLALSRDQRTEARYCCCSEARQLLSAETEGASYGHAIAKAAALHASRENEGGASGEGRSSGAACMCSDCARSRWPHTALLLCSAKSKSIEISEVALYSQFGFET